MTNLWMTVPVVLLLACNSASDDSPNTDIVDSSPLEIAAWDHQSLDSAGVDLVISDGLADGPGTDAAAEDNTPPSLSTLPPVVLNMGANTTLDMTPLMVDGEDSDSLLILSWSAQHVAVQDDGSHHLYIVAPVDWFGTESIDITVMDSGGLTDVQELKVRVDEVEIPDPIEPQCGETLFSYAAGANVQQVLLSGQFNNWGSSPSNATVMEDSEGDHTWEATLVLAPGPYQYKFIVDGAWIEDPANPNKVSDNYGGFNSVVTVEDCPND